MTNNISKLIDSKTSELWNIVECSILNFDYIHFQVLKHMLPGAMCSMTGKWQIQFHGHHVFNESLIDFFFFFISKYTIGIQDKNKPMEEAISSIESMHKTAVKSQNEKIGLKRVESPPWKKE